MEDTTSAGRVRSFVLRAGRPSRAQKRSYEMLFPVYCLRSDDTALFQRENDEAIDTLNFFGNSNPIVIEIGFGMGTATAEIAEKNPDINYLAIDVHKPGIGRLLWEIENRGLKNIRIIEGDAVEFLKKKILNCGVSAFHVFFPDPWPKKRHHKRRLMTRPFTDLLAAKLVPGGYIYMATDWADYGEWALQELTATPGLVNKYPLFARDLNWRPKTEFEQKGIKKNHKIQELYFLRASWNVS